MTAAFPGERVAVVGLRVVGEAVARACCRRGISVCAIDDRPTAATRELADELGVDLEEAPDAAQLAALLAGVDTVIVSPGIPEHHAVHEVARGLGRPVVGEYDLAAVWDDRPCIAVTGTDGKTTVTTMVGAMLTASGVRTAVVGNAEVPLVAAIEDPAPEVFVVEASSFGLGVAQKFAPHVGTWLNFAPDHLDAHRDLASYAAAKARIWQNLAAHDVAVANADDPVVMAHAHGRPNLQTFAMESSAMWTVCEGRLVGPDGVDLVAVDDLARSFPHDLANALAAAATARRAGASLEGIRHVLRSFSSLPHRVALVGEAEGVQFYDDSKATTPHAARAALAGFPSVVLIAGGSNKGLDLTPLADGTDNIRSVVAIGDAADEVVAAFAGLRPVVVASSMADAVGQARAAARPGDAVLLSPGCASFDWYRSYAERGDDFAHNVRSILGEDS